jgi:hypothetical protein
MKKLIIAFLMTVTPVLGLAAGGGAHLMMPMLIYRIRPPCNVAPNIL